MQDINFDELDKAVNSILKSGNQNTDNHEFAESRSQAESQVSESAGSREVTQNKPIERQVSKISPQRRRGQFMDMVHPSSDMTTPGARSNTGVAGLIDRQQPRIKPLSADILESPKDQVEEPDVMPAVDRSDVAGDIDEDDLRPMINESSAADSRAFEIASAEHLLDSDGLEEDRETSSGASSTDKIFNGTEISNSAKDSTADRVEQPVDVDPDKQVSPQSSPFMGDVDVEKRPLGAFSDSLGAGGVNGVSSNESRPQDHENNGVIESEFESKSEPEPSNPAELVTPSELHPDVVSVEADQSSLGQFDTHTQSGRMQSIAQQYRIENQQDQQDEENAVFDTSQYHQPLDPPVKKKSHTPIYILLGIMMIIVGCVIGYLVWVLKLF